MRSQCLFLLPLRPKSHRMQRRHKNPNRRRENSDSSPDSSLMLNLTSCLVHKVLSSFVQGAFSDVDDLVHVQGLTCGKFAHIG